MFLFVFTLSENFDQVWKYQCISTILANRISTCEQEASPTRKYRVNRHATKTSRLLPIIGNSSLSAVIIASEPPNYKIILILVLIIHKRDIPSHKRKIPSIYIYRIITLYEEEKF